MRIVVEHEDGRRVAIDEGDLDRVEANPFNAGGTARDEAGGVRQLPARHPDDHRSLASEGFEPVMAIHGAKHSKACADDCPGEGAEIPL